VIEEHRASWTLVIAKYDRPRILFNQPPDPVLQPSTCELCISAGTKTGMPNIALPLEGHDGHRRYRLGEIQIRPAG
jgi:hypothetical protein